MSGRKRNGGAKRAWLPWLFITVPVALFAIFLGNTPAAVPLDGRLYDLGITAGTRQPNAEIVIVGLTESFAGGKHVNLLPRDKLARLIETIAQGRPAAIGVDWWLDSYVDRDENPQNGKDAQLRKALLTTRQSGVPVVLNQVDVGADAQQSEAEMLRLMDASRSGLNTHSATLPYFAQAASAVGNVDFAADSDGIFRDLPTSTPERPSLPLQLARFYQTHKGRKLESTLKQRLENQATPIEFYARPGEWTVVPADKVLSEPALAFLLADKVVLIGATFPRSGDFLASPFDRVQSPPGAGPKNSTQSTFTRNFYGVEMLANSTATILQGAPRHSSDTPAAQQRVAWLALLAVGLVTAASLAGAGWGVAALLLTIIASSTLALVTAREPIALLGAHFWKASPSLLGALLAFTAGTAYRQVTIGRELRRVRAIFDGYVGEEILNRLGGQMPQMDGETWNIAVFFCDIEGFTALSEQMRDNPRQLLATLNNHFEPLVKALQDQGAWVDNYVGDLIMALFGAPLPEGDLTIHARRAVWAAIDFVEIIKTRNRERRAAGEPAIEVGIGIHCGPAVVGNLGSQRKMKYTAIGDTVNLASRLESATRQYKTPLLVTEEVMNAYNTNLHELPPDKHLEWEFVAETTVKNRNMPVKVYRPRV